MSNLIPFNSWSSERIERGVKGCTSRHKKYSKDSRVFYITPKLEWWFIKKYLWREEGASSPEELQEVIEAIYNRKVLDDERFYVHFGNYKKEVDKMKKKFIRIVSEGCDDLSDRSWEE